MGMKVVTINGEWLNQFPPKKRREVMKMIFSLAASEEYEIRVSGQKW
jgi:predicted SAM-dependent methyltransferase